MVCRAVGDEIATSTDDVGTTLRHVTTWSDPVAPEAVLEHIGPGTDLIVPLAVGEPAGLLDAIERAAGQMEGVRVQQMHALVDRDLLDGL